MTNSADANACAFMFTEQTGMIDLGTLAGGDNRVARAINNRGDIVGSSGTAAGPHAFRYTDGVMIDINTLVDPALGWEFDAAHDINERRANSCYWVQYRWVLLRAA